MTKVSPRQPQTEHQDVPQDRRSGCRAGKGSMRSTRAFVGGVVIICAAALMACSGSSKGTASSANARAPLPGIGVELPASQIPWNLVGPGWILATWSPTSGPNPGQTPSAAASLALYLVSPEGGRYAITTFSPSPPAQAGGSGETPRLVGWSDDGKHALFADGGTPKGHTTITEVDVATGAKQTFTVDGDYVAGAYSRQPSGLSVYVANTSSDTLQRVSPSGDKELTIPTDHLGAAGKFNDSFLPIPDTVGDLVLGADHGMVVVGFDGSVVRQLSVPGPRSNCIPLRLWTSKVILAGCTDFNLPSATVYRGPQLWQVPLDGGAPTALTPDTGDDMGYWNGFQLPNGTFLESVPGCGAHGFLFRITPDMKTTQLTIPGVDRDRVVALIGVTEDNLLIKTSMGCGSSAQSLLAYNPAANTSTVLSGPPGSVDVKTAILYPNP
jgi:hypothetical protein